MRWLGAWAFYLAGDIYYRLFEWTFRETGLGWRSFQFEQWLFAMADDIQGDGLGPWGPINTKSNY